MAILSTLGYIYLFQFDLFFSFIFILSLVILAALPKKIMLLVFIVNSNINYCDTLMTSKCNLNITMPMVAYIMCLYICMLTHLKQRAMF